MARYLIFDQTQRWGLHAPLRYEDLMLLLEIFMGNDSNPCKAATQHNDA